MDIFALLQALGLHSAVPIATATVTVAAVLASVVPHPAPGSPWAVLRNILDFVAFNTGQAKNATPPRNGGPPVGAMFLALALGLTACGVKPPSAPAEPKGTVEVQMAD